MKNAGADKLYDLFGILTMVIVGTLFLALAVIVMSNL